MKLTLESASRLISELQQKSDKALDDATKVKAILYDKEHPDQQEPLNKELKAEVIDWKLKAERYMKVVEKAQMEARALRLKYESREVKNV